MVQLPNAEYAALVAERDALTVEVESLRALLRDLHDLEDTFTSADRLEQIGAAYCAHDMPSSREVKAAMHAKARHLIEHAA